MIRVVVADDHLLVRAGVSEVLGSAEGIEVVGMAGTGDEVVEVAAEQHPDVIVMDLAMPGGGGISATRRIVAAQPTIAILVLTAVADRDRILAAIDAGARGYILKDGDVDELVTGVRAVAAGRSVTPRGSGVVLEARGDLSATVETPAAATMRLLTPREHAVLALVAEGRSNKEIARTLEISEKTVKVHLTNVFRRIGVSDRGAAALWAQEHGLI